MGLLDALLNPDQYGGQGGGLLDFLRTTQANNNAYQPSAGFPAQQPPFVGAGRDFTDASQFNPVTYAPNQAQPIAVGNSYQMPRMGDAGQYAPDPAALPPTAQAAQGQGSPTQAMAQMPQQGAPQGPQPTFLAGGSAPQGQGMLDRMSDALASISRGGSLQGAVRGQYDDPRSVDYQNKSAQFSALRDSMIANGEDPKAAASKAMLSILNPEAAKTVLPESLTNKAEWGVIKDDPLSGKQYGWIDKVNRTINGKEVGAGADAAQGGGSLADLQAAQNAGVTGDKLYSYLPKAMAPTVKAMIEGRQPLPSTAAMRSPATLALIDAAHAVDPTFDATVWKSRNDAGPDWSKGKSSEMVRAANQTLAHVGSLMDAMDNLHNRSVPVWNAVANTVQENLGAGEQGAFRTNAHAVAEEMSKVFKGANLSDSEIRHWEQNLSENMSPTQQRAQIAKLSELLHGSLQALDEKRLSAMGPAMAEKMGPIIKDEGQRVLQRIDQWVNANGDNQAGASPGVDKSAIEAEMRKRGLLK